MMMNATIRKWGNSQGIRLSRDMLKTANLHEGDTVEIEVEKDELRIRKAKRYNSLDELFSGYEGNYQPSEINFGGDVGLEVID